MRILDYNDHFHIYLEFNHWHKRNLAAVKGIGITDAHENFIQVSKYFVDKKKNSKYWIVPGSFRQMVEKLCYTHRAEIIVPSNLNAEIIGEIAPLPDLDVSIPLKEGTILREYQKKGVARGLQLNKFFNCDDMGLGKTIQSISTVLAANMFPCIVVCPPAMKITWQREWEKFTDKKALILKDGIQKSWPKYVEHNMAHVIIVNYQSIKKFFVESMPKKGELQHSKNIVMNETADIFKSIIIDEIHKCFPYETKVFTNIGWLEIGFIVENNLDNLLVASFNISSNQIVFNKISNVWKNNLSGRKFYKITHAKGTLYTTENHKIYTSSGRYKEVSEIYIGEELFVLSENFYNSEIRKKDSKILFQKLLRKTYKFNARGKVKDGQEQKESSTANDMCSMRSNILYTTASNKCRQKILQYDLLSKMEDVNAGSLSSKSNNGEKRISQKTCIGKYANTGIQETKFFKDEAKQSNVKSSHKRKIKSIKKRKNFSIEGRKWSAYCTANTTLQNFAIGSANDGIPNNNINSKEPVCISTKLLQSRHSNTGNKISNRSGRFISQDEKMEIPGQEKNRNIECVRVESIEVYEPRSASEYGYRSFTNQIVYDLEIENDHNYFADGILVSNCKNKDTITSKLMIRLAHRKEMRIGLSGTLIPNRPKELFPQLAIIGQSQIFGNEKAFLDRYCEGGTGANNLKELNFILNKYCFFRREKKDVASDLPEKQRQKIVCEITNRPEYEKAKRDLEDYLASIGFGTKEVDKKMQAEALIRMGVLKQIAARGKLEAAKDFIDDVMEANEKIIVFCNLHSIVDELVRLYPDAVMVTGRQDDKQKQAAVDKFQGCKKCGLNLNDHSTATHEFIPSDTKLMILNIKAGGVGLTLTAAYRVLFIEFPWTYADCAQCEDRTHRIGQKFNVMVTYLLAEDTIDEWSLDIIMEKKDIGNAITGGTDQMQMNEINNTGTSGENNKLKLLELFTKHK